MKIAAIIAPMGVDFGLDAAFKTACDTLTETGDSVKAFDISALNIGFYDADSAMRADVVMQAIDAADGVIFAFDTALPIPNARMLTFLEYFADIAYRKHLTGKPCLLLAISKSGVERAALENMANAIMQLGGFDVVRIALNTGASQKDLTELIERQTEDFYRILRQNRKYILPKSINTNDFDVTNLKQPEQFQTKPINVSELYKKHNLENITNEQNSDIEKISALFIKRMENGNDEAVSGEQTASSNQTAGRSIKQLTATLAHRFNPHLAKEIIATMQLNITGPSGFDGYLIINSEECIFTEGEAANSDIIINADQKTWNDVLNKKVSAQKAFMMGQLKVRGNFVLLTNFDQMFSAV